VPTEHLHQITGLEPERVGEPGRQAQDAVLAAPSLVRVALVVDDREAPARRREPRPLSQSGPGVDLAVRREHDPVPEACAGGRDVARQHVLPHPLGLARERVPIAAAARGFHDHGVAGADRVTRHLARGRELGLLRVPADGHPDGRGRAAPRTPKGGSTARSLSTE